MKREERKVESIVTVYIADDGEDFGQDEKACFKYELLLRKNTVIKAAERLRLKELDGLVPINTDGSCGQYSTYAWYEVRNEEEMRVVSEAYEEEFPVPFDYPEVICVETLDGDMYVSSARGYLLGSMVDITNEFWGRFGHTLILSKCLGRN